MKKLILAAILATLPQAVHARDITATNPEPVTSRSILGHGDYYWDDSMPFQMAVHIEVNLDTQMIYVFRGDYMIGASNISSGRSGFQTPEGNFQILGKEVDHHSQHYDASMPWTEWLTSTGIALHAGITPGRPSSHGCIHLPAEFAKLLYGVTEQGARVQVINRNVGLRLDLASN